MNIHTESLFLEIVKNGKFFFPAWKHYGNPSADVNCDRCKKSNLVCAIGYGTRDLCLSCAENICNKNMHYHNYHDYPPFMPGPIPLNPHPHPYITRMAQDIFKPNLTLMEQEIYKPNLTFMLQDIFKKK